jgi:4-amino-4-deoxy-L-arabinose transferase-like glycosyltransferase
MAYALASWIGGPAPNEGGPSDHGRNKIDYYNLLTDAFLAGRTSLLILPAPEMLALENPRDPIANRLYRLHDASLYQGQYYLYFGPAPVVVLFLPFRVISGVHLPTRAAVAVFCIGGLICSCMLYFVLARWEGWQRPVWLDAAVVALLGTGSGLFIVVRRPSFYEASISAGYCFLMGALLCLARALDSQRRWAGLMAAGLFLGLAAGSRPNFAVVAAGVLAVSICAMRIKKLDWCFLALPVVLCGALLGWYNFARFGNPMETGIRYQLTGMSTDQGVKFRLENLLPGIWYFLFAPPSSGSMLRTNYPFGHLRADFIVHQGIGLLWAAPLSVLGICLPFVLRKGPLRDAICHPNTRQMLRLISGIGLAMVLMLAPIGWVYPRYAVDFAPYFMLAACCALVALWQRQAAHRRAAGFWVIALTAYTTCVNVSICLYYLLLRRWTAH